MQYTHFVSVAALVTNEIGEVLLIRSPNRGWEYPGGMVEPGEALRQAVCREIKEETGVDVAIKSFAGICKNIQMDVVNIDFICEYIGGEIRTSEESLEVKWVSREAAQNMVTFPLTKKRLENMLNYSGKMYCFAFRREPFEIVEYDLFQMAEDTMEALREAQAAFAGEAERLGLETDEDVMAMVKELRKERTGDKDRYNAK